MNWNTKSRKSALLAIVTGIVVTAIVVTPSVVGSSATLSPSAAEPAAFLYDDGEALPRIGIDVQDTKAEPMEPLAGYY